MSASEYLLGIALLAVVLGGFGLSAVALKRVLVETWTGAPAVLATIVLAISVAILTGEVLGAIGLLSTPGLLAGSVLPALALTWWRPGPVRSSAPPAAAVGRVAFAIAIGAAVLTAVHWAGPVLHSLDVGIYRQDSTLVPPSLCRLVRPDRSDRRPAHTDPLKLAVWYYPPNSELLHRSAWSCSTTTCSHRCSTTAGSASPCSPPGASGAHSASPPPPPWAPCSSSTRTCCSSRPATPRGTSSPLACLLASIAVLINASGSGDARDLAPGSALWRSRIWRRGSRSAPKSRCSSPLR